MYEILAQRTMYNQSYAQSKNDAQKGKIEKKEGNERMQSNTVENGQNHIVNKNEKPFVIVVKMKRKCKKKR